jgi:hypothetical protein
MLGKKVVFFDDFSSYANDAAVQAVWVPVGSSPQVALSNGGMRATNGGAAVTLAARSFTSVIGARYQVRGICLAKTAASARFGAGTANNLHNLGLMNPVPLGAFVFEFTATTTTTFISSSTNSTTAAQYVEVDDIRVSRN